MRQAVDYRHLAPGDCWGTAENAAVANLSADFLVAPAGALTLQEAFILTHQITVSVALRD